MRLIQYKAYGEFLVPRGHPDPRHQKTTIDKAALPGFWSSVDEMHPGLSSACGIYIFGMRAGGGFTPWYVGKCNAKSGFKRECFSREKGSKYEEFLKRPEIQRGTPVLFLLPKLGTKLPFAKFSARHDPEIGWLEKEFIQLGILANPKLINRQSTRWVRQMVIPGVMNSPPGRHDEPTRKLRRLLNLYSVPRDRAGNITSEERQELVDEILEASDLAFVDQDESEPQENSDHATQPILDPTPLSNHGFEETKTEAKSYWDLPPKGASSKAPQALEAERPTDIEKARDLAGASRVDSGAATKRRWFWMR